MGNIGKIKAKVLAAAIRKWRYALSEKRVVQGTSELKLASTATFKSNQQVLAILRPKSTKEVAAVVKIANEFRISVYPISGGKNWGLGSKVPQQSGVLIDLSGMKKIISFNEEMAYIRVEPGVSFKQVEDYLSSLESGLMLDTLGSTPDASIIGNTSERGHGMALYADRFNYVCSMEIVLPTGEIIETGFDAIKKSKLNNLAKWGLGPYVDGLFTQSNLGIITKLTLWLRPKPLFFQTFIFHINDEKKLSGLMDQWRQKGLQGFTYSLRIFNDVRMISFRQRFPQNEPMPLSEAKRADLRTQQKIGKWIGLGALYSLSEGHAKEDKAMVSKITEEFVDEIEFFDQSSIEQKYASADEATKSYLDFMFNKSLLRGFTSQAGINMCYWRKPDSMVVNDIHLDACGVLWYCPAIPFTGKDTQKAIEICERICKKNGFELNLGFLFISQRTLDLTGAICYDRQVKGEDKRAMKCHHQLMEVMHDNGYSPYRLGIQSMHLMKSKRTSSRRFLQKLKSKLDPKNILAPGHYI